MKHISFLFLTASLLMWSLTTSAKDTYTFDELKSLISAESGELRITADKTLTGIVISDTGNPNMETNTQIAYNKIDFNENLKTAYIQALDGSSGLRIKTVSANDNKFNRYSKVTVRLNGTTLVKEANPTRYTLTGISAAHVASSEKGDKANIASKSMKISDLKDSDIYTFVELKDVELALPYGSWTNVNWEFMMRSEWNPKGTFAPQVDAVPTTIRDNKGGSIKVLTNAGATWSRHSLPEGSGVIKGIVTYSQLKRFAAAGNIGRYAIRVLSESDIQLTNPAKTTTLAEWNWMTNGACAEGTIKSSGSSVPARLGVGTMTATNSAVIGRAILGSHPVCNSNPNDAATKAPRTAFSSGLDANRKWYNEKRAKGEGFIFKFSTAGIKSGNLTLNFSQGGGSATEKTMNIPLYWQIEYSTDGKIYTVLPNSTYSVRPLASMRLGYLYSCPGLQDHSFKLPDTLLDQPNVWLRLAVSSDVCGSNDDLDGGESGLISTSPDGILNIRFGVVSIKY